jgi:hypothetical protein
MPFDWFISNRTIVKDNHRPLVVKPVDQEVALPKHQQTKCSSYMDEQFEEGEWKGKFLKPQPQNFGSVFLSTCQKIPKL